MRAISGETAIIFKMRTVTRPGGELPQCGRDPALSRMPSPIDGDEPEISEITSVATLRRADGRVTVLVTETEDTGTAGVTTEISFCEAEPGLVTLTRSGAMYSVMVFEAGRHYTGRYITPFMPLELAVTTHSLENRLCEDGTLHIEYTPRLGGVISGRITLDISIRPEPVRKEIPYDGK